MTTTKGQKCRAVALLAVSLILLWGEFGLRFGAAAACVDGLVLPKPGCNWSPGALGACNLLRFGRAASGKKTNELNAARLKGEGRSCGAKCHKTDGYDTKRIKRKTIAQKHCR